MTDKEFMNAKNNMVNIIQMQIDANKKRLEILRHMQNQVKAIENGNEDLLNRYQKTLSEMFNL